MPSLHDVAKKAGVSKTLVSRVINNQKGVGELSKEKILQAMKDLNYIPNALARSLVLQSTQIIGVVLDSLCEPYFFDLINGIEEAIEASGYDVIFCSAKSKMETKSKQIQFLSQGRTDGVIIYGSNLSDESLIEKLSLSKYPFVVIENELDRLRINNVIVDNKFGAQLAIDHMADLGCSNIWHITGDLSRKASLDRRDGYLLAMQNRKLSVSENMIIESSFDIERGYQQMKKIIESQRGNLPDGIFFGADLTAYGALIALKEANISVPEEIKIVGFDNDSPYKVKEEIPGLTTLSQPLAQMGKAAVEILIKSITYPEQSKQKLIFYPELIVRESTVK
jgi:LacI family transcriptional regulator